MHVVIVFCLVSEQRKEKKTLHIKRKVVRLSANILHWDLDRMVSPVELAVQVVGLEPQARLDGYGTRVGRRRQRAAAGGRLAPDRSPRLRGRLRFLARVLTHLEGRLLYDALFVKTDEAWCDLHITLLLR